jgi:hypothetical protein
MLAWISTIWGFVALITLLVVLGIAGPKVSSGITVTDAPDFSRPAELSLDAYPLQTADPSAPPMFLLTSAMPTR